MVQVLIKFARLYATPRRPWDWPTFYYSGRLGITFWVDLNVSVHRSLLISCVQLTVHDFSNIMIKFVFFAQRWTLLKIEYCSDQATFSTTSHITIYVKKFLIWITIECGARYSIVRHGPTCKYREMFVLFYLLNYFFSFFTEPFLHD